MSNDDDDRIDRGPFKGWKDGDVGVFVCVAILMIVCALVALAR